MSEERVICGWAAVPIAVALIMAKPAVAYHLPLHYPTPYQTLGYPSLCPMAAPTPMKGVSLWLRLPSNLKSSWNLLSNNWLKFKHLIDSDTAGRQAREAQEAVAAAQDTRHLLASQVHLLGNFITKAKIFTFWELEHDALSLTALCRRPQLPKAVRPVATGVVQGIAAEAAGVIAVAVAGVAASSGAAASFKCSVCICLLQRPW